MYMASGREDVGAAISAHRELRVAHLSQVEVFPHQSADCLDRFLQCRRIEGHHRLSCTPFVKFVVSVLVRVIGDDGAQLDERRQIMEGKARFRMVLVTSAGQPKN